MYIPISRIKFFFKSLVDNTKVTIPLIAKDGKERETKSGELKVLINGVVERNKRRSAGFTIS